jgi:glycosyltransferase involved in cell wall biosynthesis
MGVDHFLANSRFIARRIEKVYGRSADVIPPPVDVDAFPVREKKEDFYLAASRMVPYKRMDVIVEAFARMPGRRLVVIGDGPEYGGVRAKAGPNVEFLGHAPFEVLVDHLQRARAFVFAALEDFGILPVEAQACGTPVIAYGRGGSLETVIGPDGSEPTGAFFFEQTPDAVAAAVDAFEKSASQVSARACRANAERFSRERFRERIRTFIDRSLLEHHQRIHTCNFS